jgi:hypothetical protein
MIALIHAMQFKRHIRSISEHKTVSNRQNIKQKDCFHHLFWFHHFLWIHEKQKAYYHQWNDATQRSINCSWHVADHLRQNETILYRPQNLLTQPRPTFDKESHALIFKYTDKNDATRTSPPLVKGWAWSQVWSFCLTTFLAPKFPWIPISKEKNLRSNSSQYQEHVKKSS